MTIREELMECRKERFSSLAQVAIDKIRNICRKYLSNSFASVIEANIICDLVQDDVFEFCIVISNQSTAISTMSNVTYDIAEEYDQYLIENLRKEGFSCKSSLNENPYLLSWDISMNLS